MACTSICWCEVHAPGCSDAVQASWEPGGRLTANARWCIGRITVPTTTHEWGE